MDFTLSLGEKIRLLRKTHNLTQKELADQLKISDKTLSSYECGRIPPDVDICKQLASIFNISLDVLLQDSTWVNPSRPSAKESEEQRSYARRINQKLDHLTEEQKHIIEAITDSFIVENKNKEEAASGE